MIMQRMLGWLTFGGLITSLVVHLATCFGVDVQEHIPFVIVLHVGAILASFPTILVLKREGLLTGAEGDDTTSLPKRILSTRPKWVRTICVLLMVYTVVNFALFIITSFEGSPEIEGGQYILQNKGKVIRQISEQEYHERRAAEIRGFSGHWMMFYFLSFAILVTRRTPAEGEMST